MLRATLILASLTAAAHAAPNISSASVADMPGTALWNTTCGTPNAVPAGASQLSVCNPATASCFSRVTLPAGPGQQFPNAMCSDGSPGVFYVRPGVGDDVNKWVIHLQGGGACRDHESCLERWCGQQGALPYTANKMSSDWDGDGVIDLPLNASAAGMAADVAGNDFATWTHVFMYYCSSDSWLGRGTDVDYLDPGVGGLDFSIHHRGHTILSVTRRMLRKNGPNPGWLADDQVLVPDLDDATDVVFTGTSAGAKGAVQNVDWFMTPLAAQNKALIIDGNFDMTDDVLINDDIWVDEDGDGAGDNLLYSWRITNSLDSWASGWNAAVDAFVDESCRAHYEPISRLDRCSYFGTLFHLKLGGVPLITTPTFVRLDLEDGVISKAWKAAMPGGERLMVGQFGRETTIDDFTTAMRDSLKQLFLDGTNMLDGVFAPRCAQHVGLESGIFFSHTTPHTNFAGGSWIAVSAAIDAHTAIWDWYTNPGGFHATADTGDVGDPVLPNHPVSDPVTQFSAGPGCRY